MTRRTKKIFAWGYNMFCRNCGAEIPDQASFCTFCGQPVAPLADKPDESKLTTAKKWYRRIRSVVYGILGIVFVVFLVWSFQRHPVQDLKGIVFDNYGSETLGDAVDSTVRNQHWNAEKIDDTHYLVTLSGFMPKLYLNFEFSFDVNYSEDRVYASASSVEYDGETYSDILTIGFILGAIYSN